MQIIYLKARFGIRYRDKHPYSNKEIESRGCARQSLNLLASAPVTASAIACAAYAGAVAYACSLFRHRRQRNDGTPMLNNSAGGEVSSFCSVFGTAAAEAHGKVARAE